MAFYAHWLGHYAQAYHVEIHAWVFMTNHVHLLVTPLAESAVSAMMQALGRRYVRYFNRTYQRTGTLWEGRFRSGLVQASRYLLVCQRYIELNPVSAGMVTDPSAYTWSSYRCHALGLAVQLHTPHSEYLHLGRDTLARQASYRDLFKRHLDSELTDNIRATVNAGLALGDSRFKDELEALCERRLRPANRGRPKLV
ncbi:transposase [Simiduia curdlanivorans]|uniref:Transposase n=1 Tax=Simiduia curdlanivorans TaxID=1492769 RepID=A0ABV8V3A1_9GAMM|nr:transposase [Simiduia curdlanivorans]MDN3638296.1 transposase [Simiduia curdlanivorans]